MEKVTYIDPALPDKNRMDSLNRNLAVLQGAWESQNVDKLELDYLYSSLARKWKRSIGIGNTSGTYTGWTHFKAEAGYSIWKYIQSDFAHNIDNKMYLDGKALTYMGLATTESSTSFDKVFTYDGSAYTDRTTEAGTEAGTAFSLLADTNDYIYIGHASQFSGADFEFATLGSGHILSVEYSKDSGTWGSIPIANLTDNTQAFVYSGNLSFIIPGDWATGTVNSVPTKYWLRIRTTVVPTIEATAFFVKSIDNVANLLSLSSDQARQKQWAWCSLGTALYVTIVNLGTALYEGDYYITSSSSSANKENFFVYNHQFTSDYVDSAAPVSPSKWVDAARYPNFNDAITAAIGKTLLIADSVTLPSGAIVIPNTVLGVYPLAPGVINKGSATSFTINGPVVGNPMHQWLSGFAAGLTWGVNVREILPEWFGAKGDGEVSYDDRVYVSGTDDSAALQACLNSSMNSTYRPKITLGAKTYYHLTPLTITFARGMCLSGSNGGLFADTNTGFRNMVTTLLYNGNGVTSSGLTIGNGSQSATGFNMNNIFINAGSLAEVTSGVNGLRLNWASGATFKDCSISNFRGAASASGVLIEGTQAATFYNCGFTNNSVGSYERGTAQENITNRFYNCVWHTNGKGHYGTGSTGTLIQSPIFQNNTAQAVLIEAPVYGTNSFTLDDYYIASNCSILPAPAVDIQGSASIRNWNPRIGYGFFASAGAAQTASVRYKYTRQGIINNVRMGDVINNQFFIDTTNLEFMFIGWNSSLGNTFIADGSGVQVPWPRLGVEQPYFLTSYSPFKCLQGKTDLNTAALTVEQDNVSKALINHVGTSEAGSSKNITTWTVGATLSGYIKTEINGTAYWIPFYTAPTS